jgi:hypothetical protein
MQHWHPMGLSQKAPHAGHVNMTHQSCVLHQCPGTEQRSPVLRGESHRICGGPTSIGKDGSCSSIMVRALCRALATSGGHTGREIWKLVWNMDTGCDKGLYRSPSQPMLMMTDENGFIVIFQFTAETSYLYKLFSDIHINIKTCIETRHCKATPSAAPHTHSLTHARAHTHTHTHTHTHKQTY